MSTTHRPRHDVSRLTIAALRPMFRYSAGRDAYVLRGVGNRMGPVLRTRIPASEHAPSQAVQRGARFARD